MRPRKSIGDKRLNGTTPMAKITKILGADNRGEYAIIHVLVGQDEAEVYVGGEVEVYHDPKYDKVKAFVKRPTSGKVIDT